MTYSTALSLLIIAGGALLAPLVARRAGLPTAVGEILFGILIGRGGLHLVAGNEIVSFMALLGFVFLMFIAGMEIDFNRLEADASGRRRAIGGIALLMTTVIAYALSIGRGPLIALLAGAVSLGILVPALRETGLLRRPLGQALLVFGTVGEIVTLGGMTIFEAWAEHGFSWELAFGLLRLSALAAGAVFFLRGLALAVWWMPERFSSLADPRDPSEIGVRGANALLLIFVAFAALLHVELIIGAFLAGAILRYVFRGIHDLETKIAGTAFGIFIPIFFIDVGMRFDPRGLFSSDVVVPALTLVAAIAAARLALVPLLLPSAPFKEALAGALLLGAPLTLLVAIGEIARRTGRIDESAESAVVLAAILSGIVMPKAFKLLIGKKGVAAAAHMPATISARD